MRVLRKNASGKDDQGRPSLSLDHYFATLERYSSGSYRSIDIILEDVNTGERF